jgi:hypothetical protein
MHITQAYKAYFKNLTTLHTSLRHADETGKVAFGIEDIADVMDGTIRTAIGDNLYLFLLLNPIVRPQSVNNGFDAVLQGGFVLLKGGISLRESSETEILAAYDEVNSVVLDFITRMVADSRNGHAFWQHGFDTIDQGVVDIEEKAYGTTQDGSFVGYKVVFSAILSLLDCSDFQTRLTAAKWLDKP